MSTHKRPRRGRRRGHGQRGTLLLVLAGALVVVLALALGPRFLSGGEKPPEGHDHTSGVREVAAAEPSLRVGPLALSATEVDLGRVPLDTWVNYTFRLRNVTQGPVTVTIPREQVETLEGC